MHKDEVASNYYYAVVRCGLQMLFAIIFNRHSKVFPVAVQHEEMDNDLFCDVIACDDFLSCGEVRSVVYR